MVPYYKRIDYDHSDITVEFSDTVNNIRYLEPNNSVKLHQHDFYEILLIRRGSCQHLFRGKWIPLIPGDLVILGMNDEHSLRFHDTISLNNCQFTTGLSCRLNLESHLEEIKRTTMQAQARPPLQRVWDSMNLQDTAVSDEKSGYESADLNDLNYQGIIHLNQHDLLFAEEQMDRMMDEQKRMPSDHIRMKELLLETLIIHIKRIKDNQFNPSREAPNWQADLIHEVMASIEAGIDGNFNFNEIAAEHNLSVSYFRKIFKMISGMSPVDYVNRVRILRSLELLQTTYMSVAEVANTVGISDQNYFARLFKKIVGCPPSYYKAIPLS